MRREQTEAVLPADINVLDPAVVRRHAFRTGWRHEPRLGGGQIAVYERPESRREQIAIPIRRDLQDYELLMARAITMIAKYESRQPADLFAELLVPSADILKFSESGPATANGDIPLDGGIRLLRGAKKTLLSAARSVLRPVRYHPRLGFGEAEAFLQQCRLGQTERGSFVVTIACPLKSNSAEQNMFDERPFARRVTTLLMRSLQLVQHIAAGEHVDALLEKNELSGRLADNMLSANLCEGLLEMAPEGDDSSLQVTAEFSREQLESVSIPTTIRLHPELFPKIEALARQLKPVQAPKRQLLVGLVETLNGRPNLDNRQEGQVLVRLVTPESDSIRAKTELDADQYGIADKAHMQNLPVSIEGILHQISRTSYEIKGVSSFDIVKAAHSSSNK